ncbi:MAG: SprB repeat-containing protein, partial [Bacteroidota bacterium]|nr:SprB repeat-containing protein [Bacteroidota bacterium]
MIKKIFFLTIIILSPYVSNAQFGNGPCPIIDTVIISDFCWEGMGVASGTLTIVPYDPMADYNYSIDGGVTIIPPGLGDSVFAISAGTYTIWLQEAANLGCFDTITITIPDPQDPITTVTNVGQNLICHGDSTGGGEVNAIGGVLPYTYLWESTGATTNIVSGLWAGYHTVEVTDANGCVVVDSVLITNIYNPFSVDLDTIQQVQCYGECNGEVVLNAAGGVAPYTFNWSTGQNYFGPGPDTLLGLCQGGHQVIIADAYGCDTVVSFIISEPSQLYAEAISIQPVQCFGFDDGQAYVIGTGGTGTGTPDDYTYSWSPIFEINDTIISLTPGIHTVTVTDTNGCTASDTVLITEPTQLYVEIPDSSAIYSYCLPTYSGTLVAEAYGGTPFPSGDPYSYSWDNTVQLTDSVVNLHAGIYTVTVFDDRSCTASATFDLDSITNTFIPDSVDFSVTYISCYGLYDGSININSIAGSNYGPYSYNWTGPPPFVSINSNFINGLYEGNYAVTIQDALGCTMIFDIDIDQPDKLEFGVAYTVNESCVGTTGSSCNGSVVLNIDGGTSPYFYDNSFSGAFPIVPANQVTVVNDTLMSNFCNGVYNIDITDNNGCQGFVAVGASFTANVGSDVQVVNPGIDPFVTPTTSCFNTADGIAWVYGPNSIFNYTWESSNSGAPSGIVLDTGVISNNFAPGHYWLVAHYADAASFGINYSACDVPYSFTVDPGNMINSGGVVTNTTCYGDTDGAIDLTPNGDAPLFTILWDTLTSIPVANYTLEDQLQLAAGIYTVSITDADGCVLVESFSVNEPTPIIANFINLDNVSCNGWADGQVTVLVDPNSGHGSFSYSWNTSPPQTGDVASTLSGGIYTVTVTDALGCSADFNVTIVEPSPILASVEPNSFWGEDDFGNPFHIRCNGEASGSIIASSVGGTAPVTFDWQNSMGITVSSSQETGTILPAGSYTLDVVDANGCQEDTTIVL